MTEEPISLWPEDLDLSSTDTPSALLQRQARFLAARTGGRAKGFVRSIQDVPDAPDSAQPFLFALDVGTKEWSVHENFRVITVRHGVDPYPATVWPGELEVENHDAFTSFVQRELQSSRVLAAVRFYAAQGDPDLPCPDLWPADLDLREIPSPAALVAKQTHVIYQRTNGRIVADMVENWREWTEELFSFTLVLKPYCPYFHPRIMRYEVFTASFGFDGYPVTVAPGQLVFRSESGFAEFVRQELASPEVRKAIRVLLAGPPRAR